MTGKKPTEAREAPEYLKRYRERAGEKEGASVSPAEPFYLRRFRAREDEDSSVEPPQAAGRGVIETHLIRHGQTQGYTVDGGLTPLGALQARRRGWEISREIQAGEKVVLVAAETKRALRTAEFVLGGIEDGLASQGKKANITGPEFVDELQNFLVQLPTGLKDPTQAGREYQAALERRGRDGVPLWVEEMGRFWGRQQAGADPIEYWMTFPLAHFEPPAVVVRRYWSGLIRLSKERKDVDRLVCAVHSGPMRAFATTALGRDLGEPSNTEEVRVRLDRDLSEAEISYRGHDRKVEIPPFDSNAGWLAPETGAKEEVMKPLKEKE